MNWPTHIVAVGGIVDDGNGKILLVKTHSSGWVFPGGQVEVGENLIDALVREIKEESGIDIIVNQLIGVYSNTKINKGHDGKIVIPTKIMLDFTCAPIGGELCTSEETTESCWIEKEKVLDMITTPAYKTRFQAYMDFNGNVNYMDYNTRPEFKVKLERFI